MTEESILVHGAREHNLQNIDIQLPKDKLIVFHWRKRLRQILNGN